MRILFDAPIMIDVPTLKDLYELEIMCTQMHINVLRHLQGKDGE